MKRSRFYYGFFILPGIFAVVLLLLLFTGAGEVYNGRDFSRAIFDRNGKLLRIYLTSDEKFRVHRALAEYPPELIEALLLKEDKYFYSHVGANFPALTKAAWKTFVRRESPVGASTITMQLARVSFGLYTQDIPGKLRQVLKALKIDLKYSKAEILEAYLNLAPCGGNIEGFAAASYFYFRKDPRDLSLSEILFLVVLPQNPSRWAPGESGVSPEVYAARLRLFELWKDRHPDVVLTEEELALPIVVNTSWDFRALHLTDSLNTSSAAASTVIRSTVDLELQNLVEDQLKDYLTLNQRQGVKNGSILLIDHASMEVLAAVGSANYWDDAIEGQNIGFEAQRSPGSTLKPFIFALAMDQGLIHPNTMLKDAPGNFGSYTPENFQSDYSGPVKAWEALVQSRNIPAITLADQIHDPDLWSLLKTGGVKNLKERDYYGLSIVLGSAGLSMIELCSLYSGFVHDGAQLPVKFTLDSSVSRRDDVPRLFTPEAAYLTLDMLRKNLPPHRNRPNRIEHIPVGYKTGTSIGFKDAWSVGIFDRYMLAVWIGNFDGEGNSSFIGRKMAAPLFFAIADSLLLNQSETERSSEKPPPDGISWIKVCAVSGAIPNNHCPHVIESGFIPGVSPITSCKIHREVYIDKLTGYRTLQFDPETSVKVVREFWPSDLLELFEQAGLPRLVPPPLSPEESKTNLTYQGAPPEFISPLDNTQYVLRRNIESHRTIALSASSDADASTLYWFADSTFLGTSGKSEILEWSPEAGDYVLTVVDDAGRNNSMKLEIVIKD